MLKPYYSEQAVRVGDDTYRLVINFKTIDATESVLGGRRYDEILDEVITEKANVGTQARVVWGLLQEHHPDLTIAEADALARGESADAIGTAIGALIAAAFPFSEGPKAKAPNPRKPRGVSSASSQRGARSRA